MRIWFENRPVADLTPGDLGPSLTYLPDWLNLRGAFPVSTRMPLRPEPYGTGLVIPWVVNLLPESQNLEAILRLTRIAEQDVLALLDQIGRDTSGALSFGQRGALEMTLRPVPTEDALERILNELPAKPFLVGEDGVSMSLAGVQTKIGVHLDEEGRIAIPIGGTPSTWILKPDSPNLPGGVWNEAYCLALARQVGLDVPEIRVGRAGVRRYLLISRYDRQRQGEVWRRLHQEDFAQALGVLPASKYERNQTGTPGPKLRDMFALTRRVADIASVNRLLQHVIFNVIACNTDAHAKNYSLRITAAGASLAPLYDVMCAEVWPSITKNLSNSIAGKTRGAYLKGRHWQREAALCGLSPAATLRQVGALCDRVRAALPLVVAELVRMDLESRDMAEACRAEIDQRAVFLTNGLKEVDPDLKEWLKTNGGQEGQ
jgi:serine/threonine-protein kinase HipA